MKIFSVIGMCLEGNDSPIDATWIAGAFKDRQKAEELFHALIDEWMEGIWEGQWEHHQDKWGSHIHTAKDTPPEWNPGLYVSIHSNPGSPEPFWAEDSDGEYFWKIEETELS